MALADHFFRLRRHAAAQRAAPRRPAEGEEPCRYVAVIMDGNGRWAQRRKLPVAAGHRAGVKALRRIIERALDHDILELTVFSFSTENWRRPADEVAALMDLFVEIIEKEIPALHKQNVRVRFLGRRTDVPSKLLERIEQAETVTAANTRMTFYIAFNYGGRAEIADAARALAADLAAGVATTASPADDAGSVPSADTDADLLHPYLYAPDMHDPQLLIRTSGEIRISNFLLWQLAYTELYFTPKLWPDMGAADFDEALAEFASRRRRYGGRG
jgi:undecaprenyl diphosphate synthase